MDKGIAEKKVIDITVFDGINDVRAKNGLLTASALLDVNIDVVMILREDGVLFATEELKSESMLSELINLGVKVLVCGMCMDARKLTVDDLIENAERCCMLDIVNTIKASDQSLVF